MSFYSTSGAGLESSKDFLKRSLLQFNNIMNDVDVKITDDLDIYVTYGWRMMIDWLRVVKHLSHLEKEFLNFSIVEEGEYKNYTQLNLTVEYLDYVRNLKE